MQTTSDKLLNGRMVVEQPAEGFRIAVDTILLAAAVPAESGQKALELGCGVGGALLALACRVPGVFVVGLEVQSALAALAQANIQRNAGEGFLKVQQGDVAALPDDLRGAFDHVFMNPPYHDPRTHQKSANASKGQANTESLEADLDVWFASAYGALRSGGFLTLIHRADRLPEIIEKLRKAGFGPLRVLSIWTKPTAPARRVIVWAEKKSGSSLIEEPPLVLHEPNGRYSPAADAILREAQALTFQKDR